MKGVVFDGIHDLTSLFAVSFYDTKPVHFLLMIFNAVKWVQKIRQVYDPETQMVCDANFLHLNDNYSYSYNMNSFDLSDQLQYVCQVDLWMRMYKWWWSLLFWVHGLVLVNAYIIYKTLCEEGKVNIMSGYEVFFAKICLTNFGGHNYPVSAVQRQGINKLWVYTYKYLFNMEDNRK